MGTCSTSAAVEAGATSRRWLARRGVAAARRRAGNRHGGAGGRTSRWAICWALSSRRARAGDVRPDNYHPSAEGSDGGDGRPAVVRLPGPVAGGERGRRPRRVSCRWPVRRPRRSGGRHGRSLPAMPTVRPWALQATPPPTLRRTLGVRPLPSTDRRRGWSRGSPRPGSQIKPSGGESRVRRSPEAIDRVSAGGELAQRPCPGAQIEPLRRLRRDQGEPRPMPDRPPVGAGRAVQRLGAPRSALRRLRAPRAPEAVRRVGAGRAAPAPPGATRITHPLDAERASA